jgi:allantoicase
MAQAPPPPASTPNPFADLVDLASARLGGLTLVASDEFFAEKENLLKPEPAEFVVGAYTDRGKWMDGWESRRNRDPEKDHDWVVVRLGLPGEVRGVDVDTSYFVGNAPEEVAVEGLRHAGPLRPHEVGQVSEAGWQPLLPRTRVERGAHNYLELKASPAPVSHLRLRMFPDGGVARLRAYGTVVPDWGGVVPGQLVDLASVAWGGKALASNDSFFSPRDNINLPWSSRRMDDGWETRRRRSYNASADGGDWLLLRLGRPGRIRQAVIETHHFKGNPPDRVRLEALSLPDADARTALAAGDWRTLLPDQRVEPHQTHTFTRELADLGAVSHVRLVINPDGGVSRLRLFAFVEGG